MQVQNAKKQKILRIAAVMAVSAVLAAAAVLLGDMKYEVNDDETFNLVLAGAYGPFVNIVYMNILIARFLSWMFRTFPTVNWYLVCMLICNFAALSAVILLVTEKMDAVRAALTASGIYLTVGYDLFTELQYTKNAAVYTVAGALLIMWSMRARGRGSAAAYAAAGSVFFALGYMVRPESFIAALPFILVQAALKIAEDRKEAVRLLVRFLAAAALLCAAVLCDRAAAGSDPEWMDYLRFHEARVELLDHGMPDFKAHREEIEALGFDELDLKMFKMYLYADPEKFNPDALEKLVEIRDRDGKNVLRLNRTTVGLAMNRLYNAAAGHLPAGAFCVLFVYAMLFLDSWKALFALIMAAGVAGEYWYLACTNRFAWRAEFGLWFVPLALLAVVSMECAELRELKRRLPALIACLALTGAQLGSGMYTFYFDKEAKIDYRESDIQDFLKETENDEYVYMIDTHTIANRWIISPVSAIDGTCADMYRKVGFLGGWAGTSPYGLHFMRERGYESNLLALLDDEVYLADNSGTEEMILEYLKKRCGGDIRLERAGEAGGIAIWKYTRGADSAAPKEQ
ncbi:MAG: hypothetical protein Q4G47_01800 [Lachnospiraceae bacterium]|nr:hypothetical protein [Lachnospiraceae bacterium]